MNQPRFTEQDITYIYENAQEGILSCDRDLNILSANPISEKIFGESPVGNNVKKYIPESSHLFHDRSVKDLMQRQAPFVVPMSNRGVLEAKNAFGEPIYLIIGLMILTNKILITVNDETELQKIINESENRAYQTEQILERMVQNHYSYSMRERDGRKVFFVSPALKQALGFSEEDLPTEFDGYSAWFSRIPEQYRNKAIYKFNQFLNDDSIDEVESVYPFEVATGEVVKIRVSSLKIRDKDNNFISVLGNVLRLDYESIEYLKKQTDSQMELNQSQRRFNRSLIKVVALFLVGLLWFSTFSEIRNSFADWIATIPGLAGLLLSIQIIPPLIIVVVIGFSLNQALLDKRDESAL